MQEIPVSYQHNQPIILKNIEETLHIRYAGALWVCGSVLRAQLLSSPGGNSLVLQENLLVRLGNSSLFQSYNNGSQIFILPSCLLFIYSCLYQRLQGNTQDFTAVLTEV